MVANEDLSTNSVNNSVQGAEISVLETAAKASEPATEGNSAPSDDVFCENNRGNGILSYTKTPQKRIWEIDFLRGFCVLLMIWDHLSLMLWGFFGPSWYGYKLVGDGFGPELCRLCKEYWYSGLREVGHPVVLFIFFSISGISCAFSRSNFKRGIQLALVAVVYTLVSYILEINGVTGVLVTFGVLHFYAVCILLWAIICRLCNNNVLARTIISGTLVILVMTLYHCYVAPSDTPRWLYFIFPYENPDGSAATFYYNNDVSPGDLFTIIPWSAFFFFGTFIQPFIYGKKRSLLPFLDHAWHKPVSFLGRHALLVYVLHLIVVAAVLMLISQIFFGTWGLF